MEGKVGKVGKVAKVGRVGKVGKVGKEGKEGRLHELQLPILYQILQQFNFNKNGEKINEQLFVEIWKKFDLDTDI